MAKNAPVSIPMVFVIGDLLGSLLVAFGLMEALAGTQFVPEVWRFPNYGWVMFAAGMAIMIPCVYFLIGAVSVVRKSGKHLPAPPPDLR